MGILKVVWAIVQRCGMFCDVTRRRPVDHHGRQSGLCRPESPGAHGHKRTRADTGRTRADIDRHGLWHSPTRLGRAPTPIHYVKGVGASDISRSAGTGRRGRRRSPARLPPRSAPCRLRRLHLRLRRLAGLTWKSVSYAGRGLSPWHGGWYNVFGVIGCIVVVCGNGIQRCCGTSRHFTVAMVRRVFLETLCHLLRT